MEEEGLPEVQMQNDAGPNWRSGREREGTEQVWDIYLWNAGFAGELEMKGVRERGVKHNCQAWDLGNGLTERNIEDTEEEYWF